MHRSRLAAHLIKQTAGKVRSSYKQLHTTVNAANRQSTVLPWAVLAGVAGVAAYTYTNTPMHAASAKPTPPQQQQQSSPPGNRLPSEGIVGTNYERTFIAIKPDGVQRALIAKIISRFEDKGFQLVAIKLIVPTDQLARGHYEDLSKKPFFPGLVKFFSSGPIVAMVWQGKGVIGTGRKLLGETDPAKSLPGSIRGDYSIDIGRNIIHGSDSPEGAAHEIKFWFTQDEIYDWIPTANQHIYEKP